MITRRELVTGTAMGAIAAVAPTVEASAVPPPAEAVPQEAELLKRIADKATEMDQTLDALSAAARSNTLAYGFVPKLREAYTLFWRTHAKFPDFCEVGTSVFYDIYDWHIKNRQPIPVSRFTDGRMSITFMYTQLLVRTDQTPDYVGIPFDRQ